MYPTHKGLSVNPCVPKGFGDFTLTRKYRNTTYNIEVVNPDNVEKGVKEMYVNGNLVSGNIIPYDASQTEASVKIVMG